MENSDADIIIADKIAKGAHQLFHRYGIRAVTMDDIANSLSISKKTIYKYFADKNALVESLVEKEIFFNETNYQVLKNKNFDAVLELFFVLAGIEHLYSKIQPSIIRELAINHSAAYLKFNEHKHRFIDQAIKSAIKKGIDALLYQADLDIDIRANFFSESLVLVSDTKIGSFKRFDAKNLATEIFGHLITGIATLRGIEIINRYKNEHKLRYIFTCLNEHFEDSNILLN